MRAGQVPFRTTQGLDVLPIEALVFYKRRKQDVEPTVQQYYRELYASYIGAQPVQTTDALIYETAPFPLPGTGTATGGGVTDQGLDLRDTVDNCLWIALLLRPGDQPYVEAQKRAAPRPLQTGCSTWGCCRS